ncbi:MAG TPA: imidazoleglycerol-phosphate dehydratase HisB [Chloroflexota bacterium]|nr:imidazoleglycerol-phosphate dehydratase HisB [Chloroflexota bacterium]
MASENPRRAQLERRTRETNIVVAVNVDGTGHAEIRTGVGFLDHLLDAVARHGLFDLTVQAEGDLQVDSHHTAEDVAILLGRAFDQALGDRRGISRIAHAYAPLDEALALAVIDISGRGYAEIDAPISEPMLGTLDSDMVRHFLASFAVEAKLTLHAQVLAGRNGHHRAEALFKAFARALDAATKIDLRLDGAVPSTKGTLS